MGVVFGKIDVEVPKHEVLRKEEGFEIRKYPPQVMACVEASDLDKDILEKKEFQGTAFGLLGKYIGVFSHPNNVAKAKEAPQKIEMTAPVLLGAGPESKLTEKIAMTAPVLMGGGTDGKLTEKIAVSAPVYNSAKPESEVPAEKVTTTAPVTTSSKPEGEAPLEKDATTASTVTSSKPESETHAEKVAMTAPVMVQSDDKDMQMTSMAFLLPSKYTLETAPTPSDPRVKLSLAPERTVAAIKFSGIFSRAECARKKNELAGMLDAKGIAHAAEEWTAGGYNPPFTLPFLRTNEVYIPVFNVEDKA